MKATHSLCLRTIALSLGSAVLIAALADDFKLDVSASYGLTRWLAVEAAAGYQKSAVGNLEFFSNFPTQSLGVPQAAGPFCGPDAANGQPCQSYLTGVPTPNVSNAFVQVGQITKVPVQLSGLEIGRAHV